MEEMEIEDRQGLFSRIKGIFVREEDEMEEAAPVQERRPTVQHRPEVRDIYAYRVVIRRQVVSFEDAMLAAQGLKQGEQQILNLTLTEPSLREKIKDFMCGVNYAEEGTWEEVGEHIYMIVPKNVYVETAPASPRMMTGRN